MKQLDWKKTWHQYKYVALVVLIGVGLLLWPGASDPTVEQEVEPLTTDVSDMETQMEAILSKISGVGQLSLMLTLENDGESQLAADSELSYSGSVNAPDDYTRRSDLVTVSGDGGTQGIVTQRIYPTYRGALVVCEGGDNPDVQLAVTKSVAALTGLGSDRIMVVKWQ